MSIDLKDYHYDLPDEKIAKYPLKERADAKMLVYEQGKITHRKFTDLPDSLPRDTLLVYNDTRVIPARIIFQKESGARIEVFLLEPSDPANYEQNMSAKGTCTWKCMIGNAKRWKSGQVSAPEINLTASRENDQVTFRWDEKDTFSEILEKAGKIPLPPYIDREVTEEDKEEYQTVYSKTKGAVAAPTAGLHFTDELQHDLTEKGIAEDYLTLHVSAGTFQPIKSETVQEHPMHREQIIITKKNIRNLLHHECVIPVGTTSMRTLESTYWYGVKLLSGQKDFFITKLVPNEEKSPPTPKESLQAIIDEMESRNIDRLIGHTEIFIFPGYEFKICKGLITNYHLPGSTLILLVAALIGEDWRKVYQEALKSGYRFLSYGDGSLLIP